MDRSQVEVRARMVAVGIWSSVVLCVAELGWVALTWDQQNRPIIAGLLVAGLVGAFGLRCLDAEAIVRSRHRESFFMAWSLADIVIIAVCVALDGGATSPAAVGFFCTIAFAALSYPLRSVALIGVLNVLAFLASDLVAHDPTGVDESADLWISAVCLAVVAGMCVWQARIHEAGRAELARLSTADPLTGALNRRGFDERTHAALATAERDGTPVALLVLDLDRFKTLNDAHGHEAGDAVLRALAVHARAAVRVQDAVGRLGGDEFAVLLPGADAPLAQAVAVRIADALPAGVGVSHGVACLPQDGRTSQALHRRADERLYACKRANRGADPVAAL